MRNILALLLLFYSFDFCAAQTFGRYLGVLKHEHMAQDQLARLDFVTEQESGGILKLRATLVLYFGDYTSDEYASYDFDDVSYNLLTGTLVFDSSEREVHFVVNNFVGGSLDADLRTGRGIVGRLILSRTDEVQVERPLVQKIWGEYRGVCNGIGQRLQVQSSPSHPISTNRTDPFAPFTLMAELGDNGGTGCPLGTSTCVKKIYHDGDYDIFTGHVDFHGPYGLLDCNVDEAGLSCGQCRYTRSSGEFVEPGTKTLPLSKPNWGVQLKNLSTTQDVQGVYVGYAHLERRDIYQPMSLAITTYRQDGNNGNGGENLMVSVVASIRFGGHTDSDQSINTKFDPRPVNVMTSQPVFDRADHATDMILKINKREGSIIEGAWYSRRFGYVGTFLLTSDGAIELEDQDKADSKLTGHYSNGALSVEMAVGMSDEAISSKDSFSPLTIMGSIWYPELTSRKPFVETGFDPFTGKFSVGTEGPGRAYIGHRTKSGLRIKVPNLSILRPMQSHQFIELPEVQQ